MPARPDVQPTATSRHVVVWSVRHPSAAVEEPRTDAKDVRPMSRIRFILALSLCALLALPAVAGAHHGQRGFGHTYPHASRLCAKVANGHAPKRLQGLDRQGRDRLRAAEDGLHQRPERLHDGRRTAQAAGDRRHQGAARDLPAGPRDNNPAACQAARQSTRTTLQGLRTQVRTLAAAYHTAVDTARKTFGRRSARCAAPRTSRRQDHRPRADDDAAVGHAGHRLIRRGSSIGTKRGGPLGRPAVVAAGAQLTCAPLRVISTLSAEPR